MNQVKQLHAHALRHGLDLTHLLLSKLLQIPNFRYTHLLLYSSPSPPSPHLLSKLRHGRSSLSISLLSRHLRRGWPLNRQFFTTLFAAHAQLVKLGALSDPFLSTSLLDMYAKSGLLPEAKRVFDEMPVRDLPAWNSLLAGLAKAGEFGDAVDLFEAMPVRNVISWTSLVSGFAQNCRFEEAIEVFERMWVEGEELPNEVTVASVLPACANLCALEVGKKVERYARKMGFMKNLFVCNALLEMYAKCGVVDRAREVFDEMGVRRNVCSWNSMIMGLAVHGGWEEALRHFYRMQEEGVNPDDISFVGALLACSHGGLVDHGRRLFESMEEFSISPKLQHYGCMVDLLSRAGRLAEAFSLIQTMPMSPDSVIWGTLLGGCSFHGEVAMAETAASFLFELEPWNPGNYVILCNIYASAGRWDGVAMTWKKIKGLQHRKAAGFSSVEIDGGMHKFLVGDKSHPMAAEIYIAIDQLMKHMRVFLNEDEIKNC